MKAFSFPCIFFCLAIYLNSTICKDRNLEQLLHLYEEYIEYVDEVDEYDTSDPNYSVENEEDKNKSDYGGGHFNVSDSDSDEIRDSDMGSNYGDELYHTNDKFDIDRISTNSTHYNDNENQTDVNQRNNVEEPGNEYLEQNATMIHKFGQVETTVLPQSGNDIDNDGDGVNNDNYKYVKENQVQFGTSTDKNDQNIDFEYDDFSVILERSSDDEHSEHEYMGEEINDEEQSGEEKSIEEQSVEDPSEEIYSGPDYYNLNSDGNDLESSSVTYNHKNKWNNDFTSESNEYNTENKVTSQSSTESYNESNTLANDDSSTNSINNHNEGNNFDYSVLDDKEYDSESSESGLQDLIYSFLKYFKKNRSDWFKKWKFPL